MKQHSYCETAARGTERNISSLIVIRVGADRTCPDSHIYTFLYNIDDLVKANYINLINYKYNARENNNHIYTMIHKSYQAVLRLSYSTGRSDTVKRTCT